MWFSYFFLPNKHKRGATDPHGDLLLTALAIIQRLKPRKFKDVHLNKSPMSALNNDGVSRLVVSQIVAKLYTTSGLRITICNAIANIWIQDNYISPDGFL